MEIIPNKPRVARNKSIKTSITFNNEISGADFYLKWQKDVDQNIRIDDWRRVNPNKYTQWIKKTAPNDQKSMKQYTLADLAYHHPNEAAVSFQTFRSNPDQLKQEITGLDEDIQELESCLLQELQKPWLRI